MKGFTLVELLVAILLLCFLIGGIYAVLNLGQKTWDYDMGLLDLQQEARQAMDGMVRELRQGKSSSFNISVNDTRISFSIPNDVSNTSMVSNITYYLDGANKIIRENPSGSNCDSIWDDNYCKVLASNIIYLNFTNSDNILSVKMRAEKTAFNKELYFPVKDNEENVAEERFLTEQVRLRN